ncbi:unnamed protein product [Rotaria magnacalcarata]|uniref:Uncharacterized protein n=2 Tax=Rotaria magnacalcarata TaxID=392030 RepID=A0A819U0R1_9BILA|nr:unnamed protein product [Rotaria magnacalcarata]CAF1533509.1 unnamed protein product [Rotaria magnacalcarata]CAF2062103.1 unnamed protein product [Rotaria magnacalcarata]CAF2176437.1 unnamed protein product [Rotaria magnacalcarata]CAF3851919.1 unnamed protein product [Rotaria magnacalcarata]
MAQNNSSIFIEVSTCLRDAMDSLFTNGHNITIPAKTNMNFDLSNNVELSPTDALKLMMNKRKLELTATINGEEKNQENGSEGAKRMCIINDHQNYEQNK